MVVWIQYTLDLRNDPDKGLLILGGWATEEMAFKFVKKQPANINGSTFRLSNSYVVGNTKPLDKYFCDKVERNLTYYCGPSSYVSAIHVYQDDYTHVIEIWKITKEYLNYDDRMATGKSYKESKSRIGLAVFVKISPISMPQALRYTLHENNIL